MIALARQAGVFAIWTMVSRISGFARDLLIAHFLGASAAGEAFVVAFRLPNLFRRLFAEGALNAALVPIYGRIRASDGEEAARKFAADSASLLLLFLLGFSGLAMIFIDKVTLFLAPGFADRPALLLMAGNLALLTFPYLGFMALSSFYGGLLNTLGRFWVVAAAPVILNFIMIICILGAVMAINHDMPLDRQQSQIATALSAGVSLAGAGQLAMVVWQARKLHLMPALVWPKLTAATKQFLKLMLPGVLGAGILQINIVVGTQIASGLDAGAVTFLYYADRLAQLPLGIIGVAISIVLLPVLGQHIAKKDEAGCQKSYQQALIGGLFFAFPATAGLMALAGPIVLILFGHGAFDGRAVSQTSLVTIAMALAIPATIMAKICGSAFFAREDTRTPMIFAFGAVAINIIAALWLSSHYGVAGIALAASLAAFFTAGGQFIFLHYKRGFYARMPLLWRTSKLAAAGIVMGLGVWALSDWVYPITYMAGGPLSGADRLYSLLRLILLIGCAITAYIGLCLGLGAVQLHELKRFFKT